MANSVTDTHNKEVDKFWTLNQTGNIMVSSTVQNELELKEACVKEFQKVAVLWDAISTAIVRHSREEAQKSDTPKEGQASLGIFNYDAISSLMGQCGFFALMHEETKKAHIEATSVSINTQMIASIIGTVATGGAASIVACSVLSSIGGASGTATASFTKNTSSVRIGHILFIVEDLMGMPLVTVQVFSVAADSLAWTVKTPCSGVSHESKDIEYRKETFMFVDPAYIAQFSHEFKETADFKDLVDRLKGFCKAPVPAKPKKKD